MTRTVNGRTYRSPTEPAVVVCVDAHDLSLLKEPLRSHGGPTEETVPFIVNRPLSAAWAAGKAELRNFDIFDALLNGVEG